MEVHHVPANETENHLHNYHQAEVEPTRPDASSRPSEVVSLVARLHLTTHYEANLKAFVIVRGSIPGIEFPDTR
jgi:hypothetical protein